MPPRGPSPSRGHQHRACAKRGKYPRFCTAPGGRHAQAAGLRLLAAGEQRLVADVREHMPAVVRPQRVGGDLHPHAAGLAALPLVEVHAQLAVVLARRVVPVVVPRKRPRHVELAHVEAVVCRKREEEV